MKKSILVLAAIAAAVTLAKAPVAEAGGLRIGFGFGVPFGARMGMADPSILRRAAEANERVQAREREAMYGRRPVVVAKPSFRHDQFAQAREAKREQAAAAAAMEAKRQARIAAADAAAEATRQSRIAAKVEAATIKKKNIQVAAKSPAVTAVAPVVVAAPAGVLSGDRQLDAAQQQQKAKADEMLKALGKPGDVAAIPAMPPVRQSGSDASPFDTGAPIAPVAPATVKVLAPAATSAPVKEVSSNQCSRFIPGAGVTIKVSCSE